jgi:hypothetical protein
VLPAFFRFCVPSSLWPRLLLAGLVTGLVLGACGSSQFLRSDRHARPLVVRYTVERKHLLYIIGLGRDTIYTEFRYKKVPQVPPAVCQTTSREVFFSQSLRLPGPEPRWLVRTHCPDTDVATDSVFLLRVPATGPVWLRVGPAPRIKLHYAIHWLADGTALWLAGDNGAGTLLDLTTLQAAPTWLPALPTGINSAPVYSLLYLLSPDRRVMARLHSPDTTTHYPHIYVDGTWQMRRMKETPHLIITEYQLDTHSPQSLTLDGVYVSPAQLPNAVEWVRPAGSQWTLRLRQPRP